MQGQDCRGDVIDCEIYILADFRRFLMRNSYGETVMVKLYGEADLVRPDTIDSQPYLQRLQHPE